MELWSHQKEALAKAKDRFALFFDMGTGKTRTAIELYNAKKYKEGKTIIVAPLNVCSNWESELDKYLNGKSKIYHCYGSSKAKKLKALKAFAYEIGWNQFLIINTECFRSKEYLELLQQSGAAWLIIDEAHNFKTPTSLQTKGLFAVINKLRFPFIYLLTGTPTPQGYIDLFTYMTIWGVNKESFFLWRKRHFIDKNEKRRGWAGYYPEYVVSKTSEQYFQQVLAQYSLTAKKDEVLDLPPLLRTNIYAELTKEQEQHYASMKEFLFAIDKEGNELNAANLLSRTLRLQQILAGFLGDTPIPNGRLEALKYAIESTGKEQFLIWTIFKPTYSQISELLTEAGISHAFLTGEQSNEERTKNMDDFQNGRIRCLIAHPRAGGVGVNLTAASYSIHYTKNFNLVDDMQCEARNYRGGSEQHKKITRIDVIAKGTIDEQITEALREKKSVQDFILGLKGEKDGREQGTTRAA